MAWCLSILDVIPEFLWDTEHNHQGRQGRQKDILPKFKAET